jgi:hypothetical protein
MHPIEGEFFTYMDQWGTNQGYTAKDSEEEVKEEDENQTGSQVLLYYLAEISDQVKRALVQGSKLVFYDQFTKQWLGVVTESTMTYHKATEFLKCLFCEGHVEI